MLGALNDTHFVDKNKIAINVFFFGEIKIKSSHPTHTFW
jgi:hypothetical protein